MEEKKKFDIFVVGTPEGEIHYIHEAVSLEEAEKEARRRTEQLGGTQYTVAEEKLLEVI